MTALVETRDLALRLRDYPALHAGDVVQRTDRLALAIHAGDHIALQGPSGTGKSVLLRTLALLDAPVNGSVFYRGHPIAAAAVPRYRRAVAYLPQRPTLSGETVRDALQWPYTFAAHRDHRYDEAAALALTAQAGKPEAFLDNPTATLSGGESQVAALIRAVLLDPDVLLLDEPTAALDPESASVVEALVAQWANGQEPASVTSPAHTAGTRATPARLPRAYVWISHDPAQAARVGTMRWHLVSS
ncbi:ABC transporter ATP-binding protein [Robbsia andropogonis]|uniref:ABC transporter ATP-binding protein n=1 Tax=Robbsia andropogonis TaxID=28092 RepID=UPI0004673ABA|nr:ATP-binding cassette domain-containing protein [Robbsia andropogonis]